LVVRRDLPGRHRLRAGGRGRGVPGVPEHGPRRGGHAARWKKTRRGAQNNLKLMGAGINAATTGRKAMREVEAAQKAMEERRARDAEDGAAAGGEGDKPKTTDDGADGGAVADEETARLAQQKIEETIPALLELAWAINIRDISRTLKNSCKKLFVDADVPMSDRLLRAEAVLVIGSEFHAIGKARGGGDGGGDRRRTFAPGPEVAVMTTMAKAQGQEVSEEDTEEMIRQAKVMKVEQQQQGEGKVPGAE
ncbi:hypothetical protein THAOC_31178, partial [Thalassiosira oceanica]